MPPESALGILAGGGILPQLIIAEAARQGRPVFAIAFTGHTDPATVANCRAQWFRLGNAGAVVRALRREQVGDVVFAGSIRRPTLADLRPDFYTLRFFMKLGRKALGDDGLLRALSTLLEAEGFRVVGASEIVTDLVVTEGLFGTVEPSATHLADIEHGFRVVHTLGTLDIGQAVVVQQGMVLGVEAAEGTDVLIARCLPLARKGSRPVLVKAAKPQQDTRLDMPTVGLSTITVLANAGFAGMAIEAGRTLVLDAAALAAAADGQNLFIIAKQQ